MKQELLKGKTGKLSMTPYLNNQPAVSSAVTVVVKDRSGAQIDSGSGSINATTGELTYSLASGFTANIGENYSIEWTYTISGTVYYQTSLFDIVLNRLSIPVVDEDLINQQSDILSGAESFSGFVGSSTGTTLVANNLKSYSDDYFNGGKVKVIDPATGTEQVRDVTDFAQSTGTVTVGVAWTANPSSTYTFEVKRGFQAKIEAAFEEMLIDIRSKGFRPALILESGELKIPLIKKSLALICRDFVVSPDDKWASLANNYAEEYKDLFSKIVFQYDKNESGSVSKTEENQDMGNVRLKR